MSIRKMKTILRPTRRRVLTILAGGIGAGLAAGALQRPQRNTFTWRGTALGANACLTLVHEDKGAAQSAINACVAEIERLENEFSLYRPKSALSRLNADGRLSAPSLDMIDLLVRSLHLADVTSGAFDPTVQPLWQLIANCRGQTPPASALNAARRLVDYRRIRIAQSEVSLGTGQELTLNGIAQGYITDRVTDLLKSMGWRDVLVGLGEMRASGRRADGGHWRVSIDHGPELALADGGLAVSSGSGLVFGKGRTHNHLIHPTRGESPSQTLTFAVHAESAAMADGLSTALPFVPVDQWPRMLRSAPARRAWRISPDETVVDVAIA